jgi:hypothetical protein
MGSVRALTNINIQRGGRRCIFAPEMGARGPFLSGREKLLAIDTNLPPRGVQGNAKSPNEMRKSGYLMPNGHMHVVCGQRQGIDVPNLN